jgi:hypothetical protein
MASVVFDRLWNAAFKREGELVTDAATLAEIYKIASASDAVRLALALQESGRPFFEYCDAVERKMEQRAEGKIMRKYRLSAEDLKFVKKMIEKNMKKGS